MKKRTTIQLLLALITMFTIASCVKDAVTNISISKPTMALHVGESDSIIATVTITGDINKLPVTLTSGDTKIATVKAGVLKEQTDGTSKSSVVITAKASGTTNISIQVGEKTTTCQVTVDQRNFTFSKVLASNYGDVYDSGKNLFDMYLLENTFTIHTDDSISGNGTLLYLEFNMPITQSSMAEGNFTGAFTGEINTFFPGEYIESNGKTFAVGTRIVTLTEKTQTITLVTDGSYTVSYVDDNFKIEGNLETATKEVVHFSYTGAIQVKDRKEPVVELTPNFTKGDLIYLGDAYNEGKSHNFIAYLATDKVFMSDDSIAINDGELLVLEINTLLTVTDYIPNGTYNMITKLTEASDLTPPSLVFGYTNDKGNEYGCWYYGKSAKKFKIGNIVVTKVGAVYTINYQLFDRFGSKISGVYEGTLKYINGSSSAVKGENGLRKSVLKKNFPTKHGVDKRAKSLRVRL